MNEEILRDIEKQRRVDYEREARAAREEAYEEAAHSSATKVFDSVTGTMTVIISACAALYFIWKNSHVIFVIVVIMIALAFTFRKLSKYYFLKGDMSKFNIFNKAAGIMGVTVGVVELADYNKGRTKGAFDKVESLESTTVKTYRAIREATTTGGIFTNSKYDTHRNRCVKFGKYAYFNDRENIVSKVLKEVKNMENLYKSMPKDCVLCVNTLYMLVEDVMANQYSAEDMEAVYAAIGALHYFAHPITDIPDSIPIAGFTDNMFMPFCVVAKWSNELNAYKDWKIKTVRERKVEELTSNNSTVLQRLREMGKMHNDESILEYGKLYVDKLSSTAYEQLSYIMSTLTDYYRGYYITNNASALEVGTGAVYYLAHPDDLIPDDTPITGYIDDELIIDVAYEYMRDELALHLAWQTSRILENENDPLINYLDSVIGNDSKKRDDEIERLSSLYPTNEIRDKMARARATVLLFM